MFSVYTFIRAIGDRGEINSLASILQDDGKLESLLEVKIYETSRFYHDVIPGESIQIDKNSPEPTDDFWSLAKWEDFIGNSNSEIESDLFGIHDSVAVVIEFKDAFPSLIASLFDRYKKCAFRVQTSVIDSDPLIQLLEREDLREYKQLLPADNEFRPEIIKYRVRSTMIAANGNLSERLEIASRLTYDSSYDGIAFTRSIVPVHSISTILRDSVSSQGYSQLTTNNPLSPPLCFVYSDLEFSVGARDWSSVDSLAHLKYSAWIDLEKCLSDLQESDYCPYSKSQSFNTWIIGEPCFPNNNHSSMISEFATDYSLPYRDDDSSIIPYAEWGDAIIDLIYRESIADCLPVLVALSSAITNGQIVLENVTCSNEAYLLDLKVGLGFLQIRFSLDSDGCNPNDQVLSLLKYVST